MRFASLGSGSRGNALLVEAGTTTVMVDCGFSLRETERRLQRLGRSAAELTAVLVTHEHGDHIGGVGVLARKHNIPVWMTPGTYEAQRLGALPRVELLNCHAPFALGDLQVEPFPVPHDAREPCQFVFGDGARRVGVLTDLGSVTPHIEAQLERCDALVLESNHDEAMLASGPYPPALQARVGGRFGHLSNRQAAALLERIDPSGLQHLVAAHLSEKNNTPERAVDALAGALDCEHHWIGLIDQDAGLDWREVS